MSDGELVYRYDPEPVDFDADAARWRELAEKGGVVMLDGVVIGRLGPAVADPDDPDLMVAPYEGMDPWGGKP